MIRFVIENGNNCLKFDIPPASWRNIWAVSEFVRIFR